MSDAGVFLWPVLAFLVIGALGAAWPATHAASDIAARQRIIERSLQLPDWKRMPKWTEYRAQQDDPVRHARSARRRAAVLGVAALAVAVALARGA